MSDRSVKCFSECSQRTPCNPIHWDVGSDLWGWSLGLCILTPSLVTLIHSRATGGLVMEWGGVWRRAAPRGRKHQEKREIPGQRNVLTRSSHLLASLMILLATWPDLTPGSWMQGKPFRMGQKCLSANYEALGGCLAEGRTRVRGSRSTGAASTWRDHTDPPRESG